MTRLMMCLPLALAACGGDGKEAATSPERARYNADKAHCERVSTLEPAQKSCMVYRGWPDGKYRR